jgi:hypothetical protein
VRNAEYLGNKKERTIASVGQARQWMEPQQKQHQHQLRSSSLPKHREPQDRESYAAAMVVERFEIQYSNARCNAEKDKASAKTKGHG